MKKLVCYVTGGIGNRALALASCIEFAKQSNRELLVYWPLDFRCWGKFSDLYENKLTFVDEQFLCSLDPGTTQIFSMHQDTIANEAAIYRRPYLSHHKVEVGFLPTIDNETLTLVCCTNHFFPCFPEEQNQKSLRSLTFKKHLIEKADALTQELQLSKEVLGVHLRGTDYNLSPSHYSDMISTALEESSQGNIFISSDDKSFEDYVENQFSNVIRRKDRVYIKPLVAGGPWTSNTNTTVESLEDAVIDLILLAKTNFKVYNKTSSFGDYAKALCE